MTMRRVAVIGNAGGGKSTLCGLLSRVTNLPLFPIDKIQWKPGWVPASSEEITSAHEAILAQDEWIIDGWGGWADIETRLEAADTIILVDHPLWIHYWWAIKRQFMCIFRPRPDGPDGCPMLPVTWKMMKIIWVIHKELRPELTTLVETYTDKKNVYHIRSPKALQQFIEAHCTTE